MNNCKGGTWLVKKNTKWVVVASCTVLGLVVAKPAFAAPGLDLNVGGGSGGPSVEVGIESPDVPVLSPDQPDNPDAPITPEHPPTNPVDPPGGDDPVDPPTDPVDLPGGDDSIIDLPGDDDPVQPPGDEEPPADQNPDHGGSTDPVDSPTDTIQNPDSGYEATPVHEPEVSEGKQDFAYGNKGAAKETAKGGAMPDTSTNQPAYLLAGLAGMAAGIMMLFRRRKAADRA
jgi:LPXTG-motif cell wall-anchored protein